MISATDDSISHLIVFVNRFLKKSLRIFSGFFSPPFTCPSTDKYILKQPQAGSFFPPEVLPLSEPRISPIGTISANDVSHAHIYVIRLK